MGQPMGPPSSKPLTAEEKLQNTEQNEKHLKVLKQLLSLPENSRCADCGRKGLTFVDQLKKNELTFFYSYSTLTFVDQLLLFLLSLTLVDLLFLDPSWASINLGIFVCLSCSGIHR